MNNNETIIEQITPDTTMEIKGERTFIRQSVGTNGQTVREFVRRKAQTVSPIEEIVVNKYVLRAENENIDMANLRDEQEIEQRNAKKADNEALLAKLEELPAEKQPTEPEPESENSEEAPQE